MKCPKCDGEMKKRPIISFIDWPIFICFKCMDTVDPNLQDLVKPNSTEGEKAVQAVNEFKSKLENIDLKLNILIWGPSSRVSSESLLGKKRIEIREALINMGHNAEFSEDLEPKFQKPGMALHDNEQKQIREWANFLVVLTDKDTLGTWQELNGHSVAIGRRGFIWTTSKALSSYSRGVLDQLKNQGSQIELYVQDEIKPCLLKTVTKTWIFRMAETLKSLKERKEILAEELSSYGLS